jgi:hypothetical protein
MVKLDVVPQMIIRATVSESPYLHLYNPTESPGFEATICDSHPRLSDADKAMELVLDGIACRAMVRAPVVKRVIVITMRPNHDASRASAQSFFPIPSVVSSPADPGRTRGGWAGDPDYRMLGVGA